MLALAWAAGPAAAECLGDADGWSDTRPAVNLAHVFCGEIRGDGRPVGFHSTVELGEPGMPVLVWFEQGGGGRVALADGAAPEPSPGPDTIFTATVRFANGREKFSTFFPMACTADEIVASVLHASADAEPADGTWGEVGPSAPADGAEGFCLAGGAAFDIRFARLPDEPGRINTAFPHR
jgi:hypothetical protein